MKRRLLLLVCSLSLCCIYAQIPQGYYDAIEGKNDSALKSTLSLIVRGGVRYEYGTNQYHSTNNPPQWQIGDLKAFGTWYAFPQTDCRSDGTIWDMYSNTRRYFPTVLGASACAVQIEHCFPKSWWGGDVNDAYKDLYHLSPSDPQANGQKNNYPPGHVQKGDKFDNGSFRMDAAKSSAYGWACFEPAAEYRGDFARAYFYIATAYEDLVWAGSGSPFNAANAMTNNSYLEFQPWLTQVLLDWHRADPVSQKERERADIIFQIQGNRNPYIDYPELIELIWGDRQGQQADLSSLVCTADSTWAPIEDYTNFRANQALLLTDSTFLATWSDYQTNYTLDVYTKSVSGHNDTLINLPGVTAALVNATPYGSVNSGIQSNGTQSVTMGKSSTDGEIYFKDLALKNDYTLRFRASQYNTATSAQLDIITDDILLASITNLTRDEQWYEIIVPAGTDQLTIASVGGSTSKRACIQAIYLYSGDQVIQTQSLDGYPMTVSTNSTIVWLPEEMQEQTIYYRITTTNGAVSNEQSLLCPKRTIEQPEEPEQPEQPEGINIIQSTAHEAVKGIRNGHIIIHRNSKEYNILGIIEK